MKHVCILPWISVDRNRTYASDKLSLTPCCYYRSKENHNNIEEYWNSKEIVDLRSSFLQGKMPPGCKICWDTESKGFQSLRQTVNKGRLETYKDRLTHTVVKQKPSQIRYTAGTACNLACRMCLPNFSSKVKKVWEIIDRKSNTKDDDILNTPEYIMTNRQNIDFIDITGGEPFFNKNVKKMLLELASTNDNNHMVLHITTNATRIDQNTLDLLKKFKDVVLSVSIDGVGKIHEYIRPGSSWNRIERNIELLKRNKFSIQVMPTVSVLNIIHLEKLENWCTKQGIHMCHPGIVYNPAEFSPHNLPFQLHDDVPKKYRKYLARNMTNDPVGFIKELDRYWDTNIVDHMPEWSKVFDNLHWQNADRLNKMYQVAKKYAG